MMNIAPFKLERYFTLYEFTAKYSLCNSDCEAMSIGDLLKLEEGAVEQFHDTWLGYTQTKGDPDLRKETSTIYEGVSPEDLLVFTGAQEPIYLFCHAMLEAGDEVIVQTPCYQSLKSVPESIGCQVQEWQVRYEGGTPTFDQEELEGMMSANTKVLFINTPHNPTGYHFTHEEQNDLVELARKYGVMIFSDEVYRELEFKAEYLLPAMADVYELGVSLGVMSKAYGLPGLRIGWIATKHQAVLNQLSILKEYTSMCNSAPSEFLAGLALRNRKQILDRNLQIVLGNTKLYQIFFEKYSGLFSWYMPKAGPITFVKMLFSEDDATFAEKALKEQQLLLLPGNVYDYPGFFRIGLGRKAIPEALEQFEIFLSNRIIKA
ncbi:MAG: aminotransferase class I/II-fold pyridoxal phosphate-dependent enzyme [Bacteroidota bacterium]